MLQGVQRCPSLWFFRSCGITEEFWHIGPASDLPDRDSVLGNSTYGKPSWASDRRVCPLGMSPIWLKFPVSPPLPVCGWSTELTV